MPILDEPQKTGATLVGDLTKQLITLSSAFITVTVTFSKDLLSIVDSPGLLWISWICFVISVAAGILAMMSLTGRVLALAQPPTPAPPAPVPPAQTLTIDGWLRRFNFIQVMFFAAGLLAVFAAGWTAIGEAVPKVG